MATRSGRMGRSLGRTALALGLVGAVTLAACTSNDDEEATADTGAATSSTAADGVESTPASPAADRAYYVLPPGNYGGLPTTENSLDQLPLYDGLTPLRGDVTDADIEQLFLPQDFEPVGETREEPTGRPGTTIVYDEYGVAHVTGETREDLAFGAGWVTARDRALLLQLGRGPARAAVADVPGIDAFELLLTGQDYVPSAQAEQLVTDQVDLIVETYGEEGNEIVADAQAYADGVNAYWQANGVDEEPVTVNDVVAVTAFIGSIFGAGGGAEAQNAEFLSALQNGLGAERGRQAWEDVMLFGDPEAPTTITETFEYGPLTGGEVTGSVVIDAGSIESLDVLAAAPAESAPAEGGEQAALYPAADPVPRREASNWLLAEPEQSENGTSLAVMGPQLGYYYPEIVQQIHLSGPGIEAQGAAVPGLAMYLLIGRTEDYAWSLTSASNDVRDVFAEILCNPDGSPATRESQHYEFEGECLPFEQFDAGALGGVPIRYPTTVHGPVIGTATSEGRPVALARQRSTFGRDGLNLAALKDMTEGDATTPEEFYEIADNFGFTFNWGYANRDGVATFVSGLLPERAEGLDRRLPTLGTGEYEWQGFLDVEEHPHADGHPSGRLLNWNNQAAPGFMHGDDNPYGSVHRVELFDQWPEPVDLAGVVSVMNRAATEDTHATVWPVVSEVLSGGEAPSPLAADVVALLDDWVAEDAPRLDADEDGLYDSAGPTVMGAVWEPLAVAVMTPVFGDLVVELDEIRSLGGDDGASLVDKDLRTLLGQDVDGEFNLTYCGNGDLEACQESLWAVVDQVAQQLAAERGPDPTTWLDEADRTSFVPGLIPETFRTTNRPTYQQLLEFAPADG
ncbi:MAG: penicillin acylase family protein [Acidimicrobiales bacterium]|nr:penicillin acylase family protein [Acidimicrobiales bacterium]